MSIAAEEAAHGVLNDAAEPMRTAEVRRWMVDYITAVIDVPATPFPADARFDSYGVDSVELVIMSGMMEEHFALRIEGEEIFAHPSVNALSRHIAGRLAEG